MAMFSRSDLLAKIRVVSREAERVEVYFDAEAGFARILVMTVELSAVSPSDLGAISIACRDFVPADILLDVVTVKASPSAPHSEVRLLSDTQAIVRAAEHA